jgi:phage/plasmid-like protein (TIGR03299 family)
MSHEFDSGLFVGESAWHGLGVVVDKPPATTAEAIALAGMNWSVNESPVITIGESDSAPGLVDGWKVLKRSDNGSVLNVCRDTWTPVQNLEAFQWFDPIIQDQDATLSAAVSLQGGKRIALTAKITDETAEVVNGDPIEAYLLLFNSHDGTLSLGVKFTNIRVVCSNTLNMNLRGTQIGSTREDGMIWNDKAARIRHTKSIHANLDAVRDAIDVSRRSFRYTIDEYRAMSQVSLTTELFQKYLTNVFQKDLIGTDNKPKLVTDLRHYDRLVENFESGRGADQIGVRGTLWGAYNAVTEWTSHQRGNTAESDDTEAARNRLNSLWFGTSANINEMAHTAALAMV